MKNRFGSITIVVCAGLVTLAMVACGGGSGGSSMPSSTSAGPTAANQATAASGTVGAIGSGVTVDGTSFNTGSTTQVVDGDNDDAASTIGAVQVGMTADVASSGSGTPMATLLRITSAVRGEIDAIDTADSQLTVLGQTVVVTSGTSFQGSNSQGTALSALSNLLAGDYVVVYGYVEQCPSGGATNCPAGGSEVVATLIAQPSTAGVYRVQGFVTALGSTAGTFLVNGLEVTTTSATMTSGSVAVGSYVEVRSPTAPTGTAGSTTTPLTLSANVVRVKTQAPSFASGATVRIEGLLSQLDATANTFVVRGVVINGSGLASTVGTLADDELVDVTGTVNADGSITATAITAVQHATLAVLGALSADDATAGTLTVLGQAFTVTASTRFIDWTKGTRPFDSTNFTTVVATGDQLIVSAYPSAAGVLTATRVERIPTPSQPVAGIQGIVTADTASSGALTIAGLTSLDITIGSSTTLFYAGGGHSPTETGFFGAVVPNASIAIVLGMPSTASGTTTIAAADAALLNANCGWAGGPR